MNDLKRRRESDLELRRRRFFIYFNKFRLAALLEAEDRQYEQEFMANLETPE